MNRFGDKVVVITGGAGGIGMALAEAFGSAGARIILADLEPKRLDESIGLLEAAGIEAAGFETDVTDRASVERLATEAIRTYGRVDILCNNAGVATAGPISKATEADWTFTMGVNFWGVVNGVHAFLPSMLEAGSGHIVNTASMAGLIGMEYLGVYCASKFAVVGLSESLARELAPSGVGVTVVCPMVVDTPIGERSITMRPPALRNADSDEVLEPDQLVGEVISPNEVAGLVLDAVQQRELYVLTHKEQRSILSRRARRLEAASDRLEPQ